MLVDFSKELKDLKGQAIKDGDKNLSYKEVCVHALLQQLPNENLEGPQKFKNWQLAKKLEEAVGEVEVLVEELALIKDRVGKLYFPSVVGSVYSYLEDTKK